MARSGRNTLKSLPCLEMILLLSVFLGRNNQTACCFCFTPSHNSPSPAAASEKFGITSYARQRNFVVLRTKSKNQDLPLSNDEDDDEEEELDLITKEDFYRNLMGLTDEDDKPKKKKKKKNMKQEKRANHDNRDELPFLVQVITPPDKAYEKELVKQKKKDKKNKKTVSSGSDVVTETLGEFRFDKSTNSGDKIEIDNEVYLVQRSKCQYKYAGAEKFVMVRKILQVKPIQRVMQEDYLRRQWNAPPAPDVL